MKIDIQFVRNLLNDEEDQQVVRAIIGVAKQFEIETIAEGVEDEATLDELRRLGVDYAQGYLIGRPIPLPQLWRSTEDANRQARIDREQVTRDVSQESLDHAQEGRDVRQVALDETQEMLELPTADQPQLEDASAIQRGAIARARAARERAEAALIRARAALVRAGAAEARAEKVHVDGD